VDALGARRKKPGLRRQPFSASAVHRSAVVASGMWRTGAALGGPPIARPATPIAAPAPGARPRPRHPSGDPRRPPPPSLPAAAADAQACSRHPQRFRSPRLPPAPAAPPPPAPLLPPPAALLPPPAALLPPPAALPLAAAPALGTRGATAAPLPAAADAGSLAAGAAPATGCRARPRRPRCWCRRLPLASAAPVVLLPAPAPATGCRAAPRCPPGWCRRPPPAPAAPPSSFAAVVPPPSLVAGGTWGGVVDSSRYLSPPQRCCMRSTAVAASTCFSPVAWRFAGLPLVCFRTFVSSCGPGVSFSFSMCMDCRVSVIVLCL